MTDQSTDSTEVQLDEPISLIGVSLKCMGEGLLRGPEMTQKAAVSPEPTPASVTAHSVENLEHTAQPAGSSAVWRVSFSGA